MSKYGARPVTIDGHRFDSQAEGRRYIELRLLVRARAIADLTVHPSWPLTVNGRRCGRYVGDFSYIDNQTGLGVVEDVKGVRTPVYRLKKKLMLALYGIDIVEVEARP